MGAAAAEIAPVVHHLKEIVLASARLFADETVVPVLAAAVVAPSKATSGPLPAMTGPAAARIRPPCLHLRAWPRV